MKPKSEIIGLVLLTTTAIFAFSLFSAVSVSAQPVEEWSIIWGGAVYDDGFATATGDSVYLAGYTASYVAGEGDAFLVKYSEEQQQPVPAPAFGTIGLLALIGMLSAVLAIAVVKRKK